jgi:alcohol dehydrogenase class IV
MQFSFETAGSIVFGPGLRREIAERLVQFGAQRVLLVVGKNPDRALWLLDDLRGRQIEASVWSVSGEPTVKDAEAAVAEARRIRVDAVVALGGGSPIDLGKAVAALVNNPGEVLQYLEVVGQGRPLTVPALPCIAVPTTAGTGAEVTKNSVFEVPEARVKVSLRSPFLLPRVAILDPELTLTVPRDVTAHTGFDALSQVIEPFLSRYATPLTDVLCRDAIVRGSGAILTVCEHGHDLRARTDMMFTSLMGGMALANARLGAVHGLAGPLGGFCHAPHGALCAALLPAVLETNLRAIRERGDPHYLDKFSELARLLTARADAEPEDAVDFCVELGLELRIPRLVDLGVTFADAQSLIGAAKRSSSMKGNPIDLTDQELERILEKS